MRKTDYIIIFLAFILFIIPFTWTNQKSYNLGGDDSRLYLYDPVAFLKNVGLYSWYGLDFGSYVPQQVYIPFLILASILKYILKLNLQKLIYGLFLSLSFFTIYKIIKEFINISNKTDKTLVYEELSGIIGGFSYVLFPIMYYYWYHPLRAEIVGLLAYPVLFFFFIKFINTKKIIYALCGACVSMLLSIAIFPGPYLYAYIINMTLFIIVYMLLNPYNIKNILKYVIIYIMLILSFNIFWMLPLFMASSSVLNLVHKFSYYSNLYQIIKNTVFTLKSSIYYTMVRFPSPFLLKRLLEDDLFIHSILYLDILLPIILSLISFISRLSHHQFSKKISYLRRIWLAVMIPTLFSAYALTVNVGGDLGVKFFVWLMKNIPGFIILRTFYRKFALSYALFYSIALGISLYAFTLWLLHYKKKINTFCGTKINWCIYGLYALVSILVFISALPFIDGSVIKQPIGPDRSITRNVVVPKYYIQMLDYLANKPDAFRILSLPLLNGRWMFFKSALGNDSYIGIPPTRLLRGIYTISGVKNLYDTDMGKIVIRSMIKNYSYKYTLLEGFLKITGTKYILYNAEAFSILTPKRVGNIECIWGYGRFQTRKTIENMISTINAKYLKYFDSIKIYEFSEAYPIIYVANELIYINISSMNERLEVLLKLGASIKDEMAAFYVGDNKYIIRNATMILYKHNDRLMLIRVKPPIKTPIVIFKRISPIKYIVRISNISSPFLLIFLDTYHPGWKVYIGNLKEWEVLIKSPLNIPHFKVNGYANAWYIDPKTLKIRSNDPLTITIYFEPQKIFYYGIIINIIVILFILFIIKVYLRNKR